MSEFAALPMAERRMIGQACLSFHKNPGFEIFFELVQNAHVTDVLIENSKRGKLWITPITDEHFRGWLEKIAEICSLIVEFSNLEENIPVQKQEEKQQ